MPFYKVVIRGTADGQDIQNILYYSTITPDTLTFDSDAAVELGGDVGNAWQTSIMPRLPNNYVLHGTTVSLIDENGDVIGPFSVEVPDIATGSGIDPTATPGLVTIGAFQTVPVAQYPTHPNPKRSYLAIGPLTETSVGDRGEIVPAGTFDAAFIPFLTQGHLVGPTNYVPYRIGRTTPTSVSGVGEVVGAVMRPYASFRRSRLYSPRGT